MHALARTLVTGCLLNLSAADGCSMPGPSERSRRYSLVVVSLVLLQILVAPSVKGQGRTYVSRSGGPPREGWAGHHAADNRTRPVS
jgi:hypothetical protein